LRLAGRSRLTAALALAAVASGLASSCGSAGPSAPPAKAPSSAVVLPTCDAYVKEPGSRLAATVRPFLEQWISQDRVTAPSDAWIAQAARDAGFVCNGFPINVVIPGSPIRPEVCGPNSAYPLPPGPPTVLVAARCSYEAAKLRGFRLP
jgi:hypothetical protein